MAESRFFPKVSIIIPVYNGANFLELAINCALAQTYKNIEIIVVNDGSNDNGETAKTAKAFGQRIVYLEKENGGVSSALNLGIEKMSGEYFSWLSHDDEYAPGKIETQVKMLERLGYTDYSTIAYTNVRFIDVDSKALKDNDSHLTPDKRYSGREMIEYTFRHGVLGGCGLLIPKKAFDDCGGFDENLRYSQDALMFYKFFLKDYGVVCDGEWNVMYRLHANQTSKTKHELFYRDADYIARILAPEFAKADNTGTYLYRYAARHAKYGCRGVVEICTEISADKAKSFSLFQRMKLSLILFYSRFRDSIKNLYYRLFLKVKV